MDSVSFKNLIIEISKNLISDDNKESGILFLLNKLSTFFNFSKSIYFEIEELKHNIKINDFYEHSNSKKTFKKTDFIRKFQTDSSHYETLLDNLEQRNWINYNFNNLDFQIKDLFEHSDEYKHCIFFPLKKNNKIVSFLVFLDDNENKLSNEFFEDFQTLASIIMLQEKNFDKFNNLNKTNLVFNNLKNGIILVDKSLEILKVNKNFQERTGIFSFDIEGKHVSIFDKQELLTSYSFEGAWNTLEISKRFEGELWNQDESGNAICEIFTIEPITNKDGEIIYYLGNIMNNGVVSQKNIISGETVDSETGLLTYEGVNKNFKKLIDNNNNSDFAVISINLNRIKEAKERYGKKIEKEIIKKISKKISVSLGFADIVGRIDTYQFITIINKTKNKDFNNILNNISKFLNEPIFVEGNHIYLTSNLGISLYPEHGTFAETLLANSKSALFYAMGLGKNNIEYFNHKITDNSWKQTFIEKEIRKALQNNDFKLYYQPFYDLNNQKLKGLEAFIRWEHETGFISPADFIPVAEELDLMDALGDVVLNKAFEFIKLNNSYFNSDFKLSVNLSSMQMSGDNFINKLSNLLEKYKIKSNFIEFELTESFLSSDNSNAKRTLDSMKALGFNLVLDDFGTGASSLTYLKDFPFDTIKIDKNFVKDIDTSNVNRYIVKSLILLAKDLNKKIIAEGIETEKQKSILTEINCHLGQGYLFNKPLPEKEALKLFQ